MKIYLAGPMQGYAEFNFPAFKAFAALLRAQGHEVFNPAERDIERHGGVDISKDNPTGSVKQSEDTHGFSLRDALHDDMVWICRNAEGIALLPGWEASKGANAEWALAKALGLKFMYLWPELIQ
jgi:hypothetical protein